MNTHFFLLRTMYEDVPPLTAPSVTGDATDLMPIEPSSFGHDLWRIVQSALSKAMPQITDAVHTCLTLIAVTILLSLLRNCQKQAKESVQLTGVITISAILLSSAHSMICLAAETITQLSNYGKLLLPALTAALAATGGSSSSAALYTATAVFDGLMCAAVSIILVPMVYIYLVLSVMNAAAGDELIKKVRDFVKWLVSWGMKVVLYVFTGVISLTGIITGTADQAAVKATKMTISSVVPVVGGMLSDASETVLISAAMVKNSIGIYGLMALLAVLIVPFLRICIQYGLLRLTAALSGIFADKQISDLIGDFAGTMGLLLGMTGTVCLLLLISVICFLKGMG